MKLTKELFESLEKERSIAQERALMAECALNALEELCDHEWVESPNHGYPSDYHCGICNKIKETAQ